MSNAHAELGIGIIGSGMIARYHAEAIAQTPGARLVAVCRATPGGQDEAAAAFGVPCEPDHHALLARPDMDAVCICTPSGLHAAQTIDAARARKHVLVEKPMALSLTDADAMIAACADAGVMLAVALQRRTFPPFVQLRQAITDGQLGPLVLGTVSVPYLRPQRYYDSAAWRGTWALDGGGALMNQGIHLVDMLLWFMGDVADVQARAATLAHQIEVEDSVVATLRFANGALGTITATTAAAPGFPHRVEIYGSGGGAQIEGEQIVRWIGADGTVHAQASAPAEAGAGASPGGIDVAGHVRIMHDFANAIRTGRAPLVPGAEGRRSLALVLAVYAAAGIG